MTEDGVQAAALGGDDEHEAEADLLAALGPEPDTSGRSTALVLSAEQALSPDQPPVLTLTPRDYQRAALDGWLAEQGRGVVVLPTGAGKTVVALMAIERLQARTLVVVPTIELLGQWRQTLAERLGLPLAAIGMIGGGSRTPRAITVITFDSAAMPRRALHDFGLLIVDEVHHLPAASYRRIVAKVAAPYRLGLSATPERLDGRHRDLDHLIGPVVYQRLPDELRRERHIADYVERRLFVELTAHERLRYEQLMAEFRWSLTRQGLRAGGDWFGELVRRAGFDPAARQALEAHRQARMIALNAEAKIDRIAELLARHASDRVIVFAEYTALVERVSRRLLIPAITYRTEPAERRALLAGFRAGHYSKLVTGRVLNEGVDLPDANVAIIASGSAATREYIQRLGRVLRPKPDQALLYELITRQTGEGQTARRRRPPTSRPAASPTADQTIH